MNNNSSFEGGDDMFIIVTVRMIAQVYTCVEIYKLYTYMCAVYRMLNYTSIKLVK